MSDPPPKANNRSNTQNTSEKLSKEETDNLADYVRNSMTINEARNTFQKTIEMTELKQRIRESKRDQFCGAFGNSTNRTSNTRGGGRGGLSFN